MTYDGTEMEGTPFEGVWARGVGIVEREEIVEVDNRDTYNYWARVWSQTHDGVYYDIHRTSSGWTCECESHVLGRKVCQHVVAAFVMASSGSRESSKKWFTRFDLPERWCRHCGRADVAWSESRPPNRMQTAIVGRTGVNRCSCRGCGRRFTDRPGFEGLHYTEDTVLFALRQVARGMTPGKAAETVLEAKGVDPSGRTIQRWMDKYPKLVSAFSKRLEMRGGDAVSVDEKHYKSRGKSRWMARAVRVKTRFIMASEHWPDKLNHDATTLILKILERPGRPPIMLISDGLKGYKTGCGAALNAGPRPATLHVADVSINGRHANNNIHERHNGETEMVRKRARGFNSDVPALLVLEEVYHNFLRPHLGLGGLTPAEKAGIRVPGPDKLLTLIRCAAASRFNFA